MTATPAIDLENVKFAWHDADADVIDIDEFVVERGEHVFVEGPSGCGKSTLLGLLGGINIPRSGRLHALDQNLGALGGTGRDRFRADHVGFIFQLFNLLPYLSVIDNVTLPCRFSAVRQKRVVDANGSTTSGADRLLESLDLDLDHLKQHSVIDLSIGQQQRVAAARALIGAPEIVIADEPTSALDSQTRAQFIELLFAECNRHGTTLIFVSHESRLGQLFDRRIELPAINRAARVL